MIETGIYPMGVCNAHGPLLAVNGVPTCIKCKAKAENANRVMEVVTVEDPGAAYFGDKGQKAVNTPLESKARATTGQAITLQQGLEEILGILGRIPMPSSMKQYKLLMSVKQKIESALQEG